MPYSKLCLICSVNFKNKNKTVKFCSRYCYGRYRSLNMSGSNHPMWSGLNKSKECLFCKHVFSSRNKSQVYCNIICKGKDFTKKGIVRAENNGMWRGGRRYDKDGYIVVYNDGYYIREHRLVIQNNIGRKIKKTEVVHHINGKKDDNRLENLQLLTKKEHDLLHNKNRPKYVKQCKICKNYSEMHKLRLYCDVCRKTHRLNLSKASKLRGKALNKDYDL